MNIGIIGSGNMGLALGTLWARAGHEVLFTLPRHTERLTRQLATAGPTARVGPVAEAVTTCDACLIAVLYDELPLVLSQLRALNQKLVLTCVSDLRPDPSGQTIGIPTERTRSVAEEIQQGLPTCAVFEVFNLTFAHLIGSEARLKNPQPLTVAYCGDNAPERSRVAQLIADVGYQAFDAGPLQNARAMETLATTWVQFAMVTGTFPTMGLHFQSIDETT